MAIDLINVGNIANDGTGDDLREAFIKVNQNFEELDLKDTISNAINLGVGGEGVFKQKLNNILQFKQIKGGDNVFVTADVDSISINITNTLSDITIYSDQGTIPLVSSMDLNILGTNGIVTKVDNNQLIIDSEYTSIITDPNPTLSTTLDVANNDIINVNTVQATTIVGNIQGTINNVDSTEFTKYYDNFDLGYILSNITNIFEWITTNSDIDFGTITSPNDTISDFGSF